MPAARHDKAWRVMVALAIEQANMIADAVEERRTLFPDEPLRTSLLVVLLNISDRFAPVACVRCDCLGRGGARGAAGGDQPALRPGFAGGGNCSSAGGTARPGAAVRRVPPLPAHRHVVVTPGRVA